MAAAALSDEETRRLAREILREPEFARWRSEDMSWEWLVEWIRWFLSFLNGTADVSLAAYLLFWGVLGAFVLLVVAQVVATVRAARGVRPAPRSAAAATAVDLDAEAERFAREGRYLDAAHCLHLACIDGLLRGGRLRLSRSDPNRTLRRRLRQSSLPKDEVDEICHLLDRLERSWFRTREGDASLYEDWRELRGRLAGRGREPEPAA